MRHAICSVQDVEVELMKRHENQFGLRFKARRHVKVGARWCCVMLVASIAALACSGNSADPSGATASGGGAAGGGAAEAAATTAATGGGPTTPTTEQLDDGSFVCRPAGAPPFPTVLYNHGGLGNAVGGDLEGTCLALAEAGYLARSEQRPLTTSLAGHLPEVLTALDELRAHDDAAAERAAIIGFSRGGLLTLQAALTQPTDVQKVILMAPAHGKDALANTLQDVSAMQASVLTLVSANDVYQADHVQLAQDVHDALLAATKDSTLKTYPDFETDGHELFFEVRDIYWPDVLDFLEGL